MKSHKILLLSIGLFACLSQFASDIYTPSLPAISKQLNTSIHLVQWSISIYVISLSLSMLVYGTISEGVEDARPCWWI